VYHHPIPADHTPTANKDTMAMDHTRHMIYEPTPVDDDDELTPTGTFIDKWCFLMAT